MSYPAIKALHLIGVVCWFAGLFYLGRLFVYYGLTRDLPSPNQDILKNQYQLMIRRVWNGIIWPSTIFSTFFGLWLMGLTKATSQGWFQAKLGLLAVFFIYQAACGWIRRQINKDQYPLSDFQARLWNEIPVVFLVSIIFLAVGKNAGILPEMGLILIGVMGLITAWIRFKQ